MCNLKAIALACAASIALLAISARGIAQPTPDDPKCQPQRVIEETHARRMPDVAGCLAKDVQRILKNSDRPARLEMEASWWGAGQITRTRPPAQTGLQPNTQIILFASDGSLPPPVVAEKPTIVPSLVVVPHVVGDEEKEAAIAIEAARLRHSHRGNENSNRSQGYVTRTDPVEGTPVEQGSDVGYWLTSGENIVPDVRGDSSDSARSRLESAGFRQGVISDRPDAGKTGVVLESIPPGRARARVGSPVALVVSTDTVAVPDLSRMPLDRAEAALQKSRLATGQITREYVLFAPDRVLFQDPAPRITVARGTPVNLRVSMSWAIALTWGVGGMILAGATAEAAKSGRKWWLRRFIKMHPGLDRVGVSSVSPMPAVQSHFALRAHLEMGTASPAGPVPIEKREVRHE